MTVPLGQVQYVQPDGRLTPAGLQLLLSIALDEPFTAAQIADIGHAINRTRKRTGLRVLDVTNGRLMVALGDSPDSDWAVVDGSATVTPA